MNAAVSPRRDPALLMDIERLGSLYASRLSFMRVLVRSMIRDQWRIGQQSLELDAHGYGTAVYRVDTPCDRFSLVIFSDYLPDEKRNDRVIADQWDLTMALCEGDIDDVRMAQLRDNVPLQEAGRLDASVLVLSRANRSSRNFERVVAALAAGGQPRVEELKQVGYLYRTTAVYGSGKMGMADWEKVRQNYPDFARPFAAEMLTCYLLRNFSIEQAEHIASQRSPESAVPMDREIRRYIGIGNATGLGMAPYLVKHPQLIDHWVTGRERAVQAVLCGPALTGGEIDRLLADIARARQHLAEIFIEDERQSSLNRRAAAELSLLSSWLEDQESPPSPAELLALGQDECCLETQEILTSLLLELYPDKVDGFIDSMMVEEQLRSDPAMPAERLQQIIRTNYDWALQIDFSRPGAESTFWYRSAEKLEPRLGERGVDPGCDREMALGVARAVARCARDLAQDLENHPGSSVARFLLRYPQHRPTVRRVQGMATAACGEIRANLLDRDILPLHLLRCKLSFFGVSKFDPKSRLWVRNTMFQGAPLVDELDDPARDNWYFPLAPEPAG
jgi:hypothetical protein